MHKKYHENKIFIVSKMKKKPQKCSSQNIIKSEMESEEIKNMHVLEIMRTASELNFDDDKIMDHVNDNSSSYNKLETSADSNLVNMSF
jgi:hypothetical protein